MSEMTQGGKNKPNIMKQTLMLYVGSCYTDSRKTWRVDIKLFFSLIFWLFSIWVSQRVIVLQEISFYILVGIFGTDGQSAMEKENNQHSLMFGFFFFFFQAIHPQETKHELFSLWGDVFCFVLHLLRCSISVAYYCSDEELICKWLMKMHALAEQCEAGELLASLDSLAL